MRCPVCSADAEDQTEPGIADRRDIRCLECGEYSISGTAETEFETVGMTRKERLAELARAKKEAAPGQQPFIRHI